MLDQHIFLFYVYSIVHSDAFGDYNIVIIVICCSDSKYLQCPWCPRCPMLFL